MISHGRILVAVSAMALMLVTTMVSGEGIKVSRHRSTPMTNDEADRILSKGVSLLQHDDSPPQDVECKTDLHREGDVTVFDTGTGSVTNGEQLAELLATPGVHVVTTLDYCAGMYNPSVIGCGNTPGDSFVVERLDSIPLSAVCWMHEHGHNKGLDHREEDDDRFLMNASLSEDSVRINNAECAAFSEQGATVSIAHEQRPARRATTRRSNAGTTAPAHADIKRFVHSVHIHGITYEDSKQFSPEDVPLLLQLLKTEHGLYRMNVVMLLGMIGDDRVIEPLLSYFREEMGSEFKYEEFKAKKAVPFALGYTVNRTKSPEGLSFLEATATNPSAAMKSVGRPRPDESAMTWSLMQSAVWGLALTGTSRAGDVLSKLSEPPDSIKQTVRVKDFRAFLVEAQRKLTDVQKNGLDASESRNSPK